MNSRKDQLKQARIRQQKILDLFKCYALHVRDWEPSKEGDWKGIEDSIFIILFDEQED